MKAGASASVAAAALDQQWPCVPRRIRIRRLSGSRGHVPRVHRRGPEHYHLEFENEYVRVIPLPHSGARQVKMHNHPFGSVVIFMTDQNLHQTLENGTTEDAHNKAGHVLWGNGSQARHMVRTSPISCTNTSEWISRRPCLSAGRTLNARRLAAASHRYRSGNIPFYQ